MPLVEVHPDLPDEPIIGGVPCGPSLVPFDHVDETVSEYLTPHPGRTRFMKVQGKSMLGFDIEEGDLLAFSEVTLPGHGSIVLVATTGGEFTVKRYEPLSDPPGLYGYGADNLRTHITLDEAVIVGVMVSKSRKFQTPYKVVFTHNW